MRTNLKETITSRSRLHPCNRFSESVVDFCDVINHVDLDCTGEGEIKIHTKVVMFVTADNVKFLVSSVVPLSKPIQK